MGGKILQPLLLRVQAGQVHDLFDPGGLGGLGEDIRAVFLHLLEVAGVIPHGVHQVVDHVDAVEGLFHTRSVREVRLDGFYLVEPGESFEPIQLARHRPHGETGIEQGGNKPATDVSGRSGNQDSAVSVAGVHFVVAVHAAHARDFLHLRNVLHQQPPLVR